MEGIVNILLKFWPILATIVGLAVYLIRLDWKIRNTMATKMDMKNLESLLTNTCQMTALQLKTIQDYLSKQNGAIEKNIEWHDHHLETYHLRKSHE